MLISVCIVHAEENFYLVINAIPAGMYTGLQTARHTVDDTSNRYGDIWY